eukprot:scaffold144792_cov28-Tisochrysis_lutea.AAC.1
MGKMAVGTCVRTRKGCSGLREADLPGNLSFHRTLHAFKSSPGASPINVEKQSSPCAIPHASPSWTPSSHTDSKRAVNEALRCTTALKPILRTACSSSCPSPSWGPPCESRLRRKVERDVIHE